MLLLLPQFAESLVQKRRDAVAGVSVIVGAVLHRRARVSLDGIVGVGCCIALLAFGLYFGLLIFLMG